MNKVPPDLQLAFDVGHSSIGWAVLKAQDNSAPEILGCGSVIFPADDCLASERRTFRRQRRHIRATRQRIERMAVLIRHLIGDEVPELASRLQIYLAREHRHQGQGEGHAAPWLLAARALRGGEKLTWCELWDVLRWYAHNRGYGQPVGDDEVLNEDEGVVDSAISAHNWTESEEEQKNVKKVQEACALMRKEPRTDTMAETVCKKLYERALAKLPEQTEKAFHAMLFDPAVSENYAAMSRYKGENASAYPREVVEREVRKILDLHSGIRPGLNQTLIAALLNDWRAFSKSRSELYLSKEHAKSLRDELNAHRIFKTDSPAERRHKRETRQDIHDRFKHGKIVLPKRYRGGLLFGGLKTRYDNRIISTCPITYGRELKRRMDSGASFENADVAARKVAKVPSKKCLDFLKYRWAVNVLANIRVKADEAAPPRSLSTQERRQLHRQMCKAGFLTKAQLDDAVKSITRCPLNNLDATYNDTPEAEESLTLDLARQYAATNTLAGVVWPTLEPWQGRVRGQLRRGKRITIAHLHELVQRDATGERHESFCKALQAHLEELQAKAKAKKEPTKQSARLRKKKVFDWNWLLKESLQLKLPPARAPFHRRVLRQAVADVLRGFDPRKKMCRPEMKPEDFQRAEAKRADGCLVDVSSITRARLGDSLGTHEWLARQSNNHLVRHRLLILERLTNELINEPRYAKQDATRIGGVVVEVARDLVTFSGMKNDKIGSDKGGALKSIKEQHHRVAKFLLDQLAEVNLAHLVNHDLIWKGKVADDLDWRCPYTGECIDPVGLAKGDFDIDHIIPKSQRLTNAMSAVVITRKRINAAKGNRTALEFILWMNEKDEQGRMLRRKERDELCLRTPEQYRDFVEALKTHASGKPGPPDPDACEGSTDHAGGNINPYYLPGTTRRHPDYVRRKTRIKFLRIPKYDKDKQTFAPRDLTITSHLNRLAQETLLRALPHLAPDKFISIPGAVTGSVRDCRGWNLLRCLADEKVCGAAALREVERYNPETLLVIKDEKTGEPQKIKIAETKANIRKLTHLHHALDACLLGLLGHLLPKDGKLWELFAMQELLKEEKETFETLAKAHYWQGWHYRDLFSVVKIPDKEMETKPDKDRCYRIRGAENEKAKRWLHYCRQQIIGGLREKRVIQHVPSDRSGLGVDATVYRVLTNPDEEGEIPRLIRALIVRKRRELGEMRECFAQLPASSRARGRDAESDEARAARKAAQAKRKELSDEIGRRDKELQRMTDTAHFTWLIKRIRRDSQGGKDLTKEIKAFDQSRSGATPAEPASSELESNEDNVPTKKRKKGRKAELPVLGHYEGERTFFLLKYDIVARGRVFGLPPESNGELGKLRRLKAAQEITENFAIARLDHVNDVKLAEQLVEEGAEAVEGTDGKKIYVILIRRHRVPLRLKELRRINGDIMPTLYRPGMLIEVPHGDYWPGRWRILSVMDAESVGISFKIAKPDAVEKLDSNGRSVTQLIANGLRLLPKKLTGIASDPSPAQAGNGNSERA